MDVTVFLQPKVDLEHITKILDELGHEGRTHTTRTWGRHQMERIWEAAKGYRAIDLDHFVPPSIGRKVEVIHELKNSLPLFSVSQKRFCRPPEGEGEDVLWGYNHASSNTFTGPGYFLTRKSDVEGEVAIDYRTLPKGRVDTWPEIVPNEARLGRFVYAGMVDHVRGISNHVCIGRAEKGGAPMDAWFVLCRKDPN